MSLVIITEKTGKDGPGMETFSMKWKQNPFDQRQYTINASLTVLNDQQTGLRTRKLN